MGDFTPKLYEDILQDAIDWAVAHTNDITDFNEGSINRAILSAVALSIEDNYFEIMLSWVDAMRTALQDSLSFVKKAGEKAVTSVVFSRSVVAAQNYPINIGTIIATSDGVRFITTQSGEISIGNTDSASLSVEAESAGIDGNVNNSTITVLVSKPTGIETVTNAAAATGGVDEETDDNYNARFQKYLQGLTRTTPQGIEGGAEGVAGVDEALLVETTSPGVLRLYVDDGSGSASQALLDAVEAVIAGDGTPANPGYRPAGILIGYFATTKITTNPSLEIFYDVNEDKDTLKPIVAQNIIDYIDSLLIGQDLIVNELRRIIMGTAGVRDVSITVPAATIPASKLTGEIIKHGTSTIVMTLYQDLT